METNAIRKPDPSKPNRTPKTKAIAFRQRNNDRPVIPNTHKQRNLTMLTQLRPLNSTTVTLDNHPNGIGVLLAGNHIGSFELYPVWGLTDNQYTTAIALGLDVSDECYVCNNQIFITQAQAAAQVVADHLCSTATWEMPDYI